MSRGTLWSACRALDILNDLVAMHGFRSMTGTILDEALGFRAEGDPARVKLIMTPNGMQAAV